MHAMCPFHLILLDLIILIILGEFFLSKMSHIFIVYFMHATCPVHHTPLDLISLTVFADGTNYEAPHSAVFSINL
jgi:hypothetical protein